MLVRNPVIANEYFGTGQVECTHNPSIWETRVRGSEVQGDIGSLCPASLDYIGNPFVVFGFF